MNYTMTGILARCSGKIDNLSKGIYQEHKIHVFKQQIHNYNFLLLISICCYKSQQQSIFSWENTISDL